MNRPIALFDSGIGGLTVLQEVIKILPNENYVYLADNCFFPYGVKDFDQLNNRLQKVTEYLLSLDVKAIVVACNTASLHLKSMQKIAKIPIIDVILPTCDEVVATSQNKKVCLLATDATVRSGRYKEILNSKGIEVFSVACSEFVPLAESGQWNSVATKLIVEQKLLPIAGQPFDTVIFGCTHFGLLEKTISQSLGNRSYVQCGKPTALRLRQILRKYNLIGNSKRAPINLFSTGDITVFDNVPKTFSLDFSDVKVVQLI